MTNLLQPDAVLLVIDVQQGFDDPYWGERNNPDAEANIGRLIDAWTAAGRPVVRVRHASTSPRSPLRPDAPGHAYKPVVAGFTPALEIAKSVHSAFLGTPDLGRWLQARGARQVVITGIQTNRCCETTARMAGDLGYDVLFAIDATHTFGEAGPDGVVVTGDEFARATAANIHGHFGTVVHTRDLLA
ncbi:Nicotinamidase-related amidase [Micromonospora pattaloongensis]|uniref:Nicotinamidase-related amidase n=1 Tax=Micromonospora pattaloongensis TaxID=405436 RepID=A0A1H3KRF1_9ACTN|nr:cysteine hydrolase family protein [Micromonospora pattaloongensis]SDY54576.1 Nicotinamidase-related amidase [Micromonospora pattaloongensis]